MSEAVLLENPVQCFIIFICVRGGLHVPFTETRQGQEVSPCTTFCLVHLLLNLELTRICQLASQASKPGYFPVSTNLSAEVTGVCRATPRF